MGRNRVIAAAILLATTLGCGENRSVYTLPAGSAERGEAAFLHFRCYDCHRLHGVQLPPGEEPNQAMVELGTVDRPRSYEELVTSIINPSHRLAKGYNPELVSKDGMSRMPVYNNVMTITQLSDIIAFLQAHTDVRPYEKTIYPDYYNP